MNPVTQKQITSEHREYIVYLFKKCCHDMRLCGGSKVDESCETKTNKPWASTMYCLLVQQIACVTFTLSNPVIILTSDVWCAPLPPAPPNLNVDSGDTREKKKHRLQH